MRTDEIHRATIWTITLIWLAILAEIKDDLFPVAVGSAVVLIYLLSDEDD